MKAEPRPTPKADNLLARTASRTSEFLEQFSDVKCTEHVRQEKLNKDEKVELKEDSTYDYLVILTNAGGELSLAESRIPVHEAEKRPEEYVHAVEQWIRHALPGLPSLLLSGVRVHSCRRGSCGRPHAGEN